MRLKTTLLCAVFVLFIGAAASAQTNQYPFQDASLPGSLCGGERESGTAGGRVVG